MKRQYVGCAGRVTNAVNVVYGRLVDLATITRRLTVDAGFSYLQHVVALHAGIRDGRLIGRPSFWQLSQVRRARAAGHPIHLVAHEDVLVFRKVGAQGG